MSQKDWIEKDYYQALGVPKDASQADIKKAFRALAKKHHPDSNENDPKSEARFKEVSEAYDVLSDEARRKEYDEARSLFGSGGFRMPGGFGGRPGQGGATTFDLNDLLRGGRRWWRRVRRRIRRHLQPGGRGAPRAPWRRRREHGHPVLRRGARRPHAPAASHDRRPLRRLLRHRCPQRHDASGVPHLRRRRTGQPQRGRLRPPRAVPGVPRPRARRRRPVPELLGQRSSTLDPHRPGAHPGGRAQRVADPAARQGRTGRVRRRAGRPPRGRRRDAAPGVRP